MNERNLQFLERKMEVLKRKKLVTIAYYYGRQSSDLRILDECEASNVDAKSVAYP
jgi:hypothetical protein